VAVDGIVEITNTAGADDLSSITEFSTLVGTALKVTGNNSTELKLPAFTSALTIMGGKVETDTVTGAVTIGDGTNAFSGLVNISLTTGGITFAPGALNGTVSGTLTAAGLVLTDGDITSGSITGATAASTSAAATNPNIQKLLDLSTGIEKVTLNHPSPELGGVTVGSGKTLTVASSGAELANGSNLIVNGTVSVAGTLTVLGTLTGTGTIETTGAGTLTAPGSGSQRTVTTTAPVEISKFLLAVPVLGADLDACNSPSPAFEKTMTAAGAGPIAAADITNTPTLDANTSFASGTTKTSGLSIFKLDALTLSIDSTTYHLQLDGNATEPTGNIPATDCTFTVKLQNNGGGTGGYVVTNAFEVLVKVSTN
jgi:hypothetical protein